MSELKVQELDQKLVVDSRLIAIELGVNHSDWFRNVVIKYQQEIEAEFGVFRFENGKPLKASSGGRPERYAFFTEEQATVLMTYSRNTEQVRKCKRKLVKAFTEAKRIIKEVIPAQNTRIRELELEVELAKQNNYSIDRIALLSQLHGVPTTLVLLGRSHQVLEVEKPTIEVIDKRHNQNVNFVGQTLVQLKDYLQRVYGIKFKSGAEIKRRLEHLGKEDLLSQTPRSVISDYVPRENIDKICQILISGNRQMLLGE